MKWSAAGRPTADGPDRRTTRRAARPAALLTGLFLAAGTGLAPPATAAPSGDGGPADRPVQIQVTRFEPRTLAPGSVITVNGSLTNTGDATVSHLGLRLQRGAVLTSRARLVAEDRKPDPDTAVVPPFQPLPRQLEPGESVTFTYRIPATALDLDATGVYPVLLNVNGTVQGTEQRVGELDSYLVEPPAPTAARTTVAWLWPLVDEPHRDASGHFTDDRLAREITTNGRLDRALAVLERLPRAVAPGASAPTLTVPVTLAIDPALVEALQIMAAGPYRVPGGQGGGTQAAQKFLSRLKALAPLLQVVALPYGDVDADALQTAGRADVVVRSLPGTPSGTAHDDRLISGDGAVTPSATASSSTTPAPPSGGSGPRTSAGERILTSALGVHPRTDLAWLPPSPVHPETLQTLQANGVDQVVLPAAALTAGDAALGIGRATAVAGTTVPTAAGSLPALVADTRLGRLADAGQTAGGSRMAQQRYLAELTLLSSQAAGGTAARPTVLVTPPREVDADPAAVAAMMTATTALPWLQAGSVKSLSASPTGPAGRLAAPSATPSLDPTGLADVAAAVAVRDALAGSAVGDVGAALAPYDAAASRATSLEWRDDRAGFRAAARDLHATLTRLSDRVTLVAPADGTYSLASNDAPLVLTVRNDLPFAVRVLLRLSTPESGLQFGDIGRQTLAPGQRTTLQVPTQLRRSGGFAVTASLTTPGGQPLGDAVQIHVKSTAYGPIGLFITIGAAALLGLLFLRRLIRFVLRRRRGSGGRDDGLPGPPAEGAAVPLPPTRSPV